ncbi:hypothetical protein B5V90_11000 [Heyndrickxia sporothermodurans]|nr:hypothetical protein B5V90_11000 [Heyndrickxia sporothermodurans]
MSDMVNFWVDIYMKHLYCWFVWVRLDSRVSILGTTKMGFSFGSWASFARFVYQDGAKFCSWASFSRFDDQDGAKFWFLSFIHSL